MSDGVNGFVEEALRALERVQKSRIWFEPYSDCLDGICAGLKALEELAGYDAVYESGGDPMLVKRYRENRAAS